MSPVCVDECFDVKVFWRHAARGGGTVHDRWHGTLTYPREGFGAPKDRTGHATGRSGLPAGTEVFSADDHISLAEDIFYERFPESS